MTVRQALEQAMKDQQAGRFKQAEAIYRQILTANPNEANAIHLLGLLEYQQGRAQAALPLIEKAVLLMPQAPTFRTNLSQILSALGRNEQAVEEAQKAVGFQPNNPEFLNNLGKALQSHGRLTEAIGIFRRAIDIKPDFIATYANLGSALRASGDYPQAIAVLRQAAGLQPNSVETMNNLGNALQEFGQVEEAETIFQKILSAKPDFAEAHNNLGTTYRAAGQFGRAIEHYRKAVQLQPDMPMPHFNLGLTLLLLGQFEEGWRENEWRWKVKEHGGRFDQYPSPEWDGSDLKGRTIFLFGEQGFGDAIQFARYVPLIAQRGARIILACQKPLLCLMKSLAGVSQLVTHGDPMPAFDVRCALMSVPRIFGTADANIPADIPYLSANADESSRWRKRLDEFAGKLKVGIAWAGRPEHKLDRLRSIAPKVFAPLNTISSIQLVNLQKGDKSSQGRDVLNLIDWTAELTDFADTAALVENLDLVITADTAVAHLAGALGKKVWVLLPFVSDWRWLLNRSDSPWYPTMRLFRQPAIGDWNTPIQQVVQALQELP